MRFLFVSAQLPGHLDWGGMLLTAVELRRRGHDVQWASGAPVQALVEQAGLDFHCLAETGWRWPPPPPLPAQQVQQAGATDDALHQRQLRALDQWLDEERVARATAELIALGRARPAGVIVAEMFMSGAALAAEALGVPFVVAGWPAPLMATGEPSALTLAARRRLAQLLDRFSLAGTNWTPAGPPSLCSPHLHLDFWSRRWYAGVRLGAQTHHMGGLAPAAPPPAPPPHLPPPDAAPWVLVTLGTSFNEDANFFIAAAHAVDRLGGLPLVVLGRPLTAATLAPLRGRLPRSAKVFPAIPYEQVFPYLAAAIHHGGAGTTHALVRHAVPQLIVPHAGDQLRQAQGVERSGVGVHVPPAEATLDRLTQRLARLLPDLSAYRADAASLRAEFDQLGGAPAAAELLESTFAGEEDGCFTGWDAPT